MGLIYYYQIARMQDGMDRGEATTHWLEWESNSNSISPFLCVGWWLLMMTTTTVVVNEGEAGEMKEIKVNDKWPREKNKKI